MPEYPDITIYCEALAERLASKRLERLVVTSPFVLRTFEPEITALRGLEAKGTRRIGKKIVIEFESELFLVVHLMISGRLTWKEGPIVGIRPGGKIGLAAFQFGQNTLLLTEVSSKKRAALYVVRGADGLKAHHQGGLDVLTSSKEAFSERLRAENRTLKRALTSPRLFDGIGNAYSDEILFAARLSPLRLTQALTSDEVERLFLAIRKTLTEWTERLRMELKGKFPDRGQVTAFRPDFATHGKFGKPCPVCGKPIQRIVYAENETNYCAVCQNEGRLLADRALSKLLKADWPKTLEEMLGD